MVWAQASRTLLEMPLASFPMMQHQDFGIAPIIVQHKVQRWVLVADQHVERHGTVGTTLTLFHTFQDQIS